MLSPIGFRGKGDTGKRGHGEKGTRGKGDRNLFILAKGNKEAAACLSLFPFLFPFSLLSPRACPFFSHFFSSKAIDYTLKRWEALSRFVDDGGLEIDNNLVENSIRPSALGKRNFLFIGHPEAGERSAVVYTLLGSCRRHGVNPFDYLRDLFTRLPAARITQIREFTPAAWAKAKAKLIAQTPEKT